MRRIIPALLIILGSIESSGGQAQTVDVRTLANSCGICHGTDGKPPKNGLERLAGMNKREFIDDMHEMQRSPANKHLMGWVASGFSDTEITAMANYFSTLAAGKEARHGKH